MIFIYNRKNKLNEFEITYKKIIGIQRESCVLGKKRGAFLAYRGFFSFLFSFYFILLEVVGIINKGPGEF